MLYTIAYQHVPLLPINSGFAKWLLVSGFSTRSPFLLPFLTLLVQYFLAPTLTVSWQEIEDGDLLGGGGGGGGVWVTVLAGRWVV